MSTLRVSNIEAKADASSPTINEKVKITNSNGDVMLQLDGATSGITTVGINTTTAAFTVDGNQNFNFVGIVTAASFSGNLTGNATGLSGSPTLSGITSVSTTNLTVNGNAYPSAGPLSNRNLIINGAMQVAQRGTSSTLGTYGTVDRFQPAFIAGAQTQTQETLTSGSPYDEGFRYFLRIANTTASTSANTLRQFSTKLEAQTIAQSGWNYTSSTSYVTVSFWVRASVGQEYYAYLLTQDGTPYKYSFSLGTLSADTWTKITKTVPGNSNLTVNNDNEEGLRLVVSPFYGTDYTDSGVSVDTWATYSGSTRTPDYTNTWGGTTDATFDVTGVQLEVGSVATPFEHRSFGDELVRCQRYYQKSFDYGTAPGSSISQGAIMHGYTNMPAANYVARFGAQFRTSMRAQPTVVTYDTAGNSGKCNYPDTSTNQSFTIIHRGENNFSAETSSLSSSTDARLYFHYTAEAEL